MFARVGDPQQWGLILSKILAVWSLNTHNRTRSRRPFVRHHAVALSFFQNRDLHRRSSDVMFITIQVLLLDLAAKGPGTKSISVIAKMTWYKINFSSLQLY